MKVRIADYPQLRWLCWQLKAEAELDGAEALEIYERNWRHVETDAIDETEQALIDQLVEAYGNGIFMPS